MKEGTRVRYAPTNMIGTVAAVARDDLGRYAVVNFDGEHFEVELTDLEEVT
jgi:hypothetical protein